MAAHEETIVHADGKFLPEAFAYGIVLIWHARNNAKTWGEYRRLASPSYALAEEEWDAPPYEDVRSGLLDGLRCGSIYRWRAETPPQELEPTDDDIRAAYSDEYGAHIHPTDDEEFNEERVPSGVSGPWIEVYMNDDKSWVPEQIWEQYGRVGIYLAVDWAFYELIGDDAEIIEALRESGLTVHEDPSLILATSLELGEPTYSVVLQRARERLRWW